MKNKFKNKTGITLIALVITIIVLLILAGVSITMISSQDGILKKARTAKETQKKATEEEKVKLAIQGAMINENGTIDETELKTELGKLGYTIDSLPAEITINGTKYTITKNGELEENKAMKMADAQGKVLSETETSTVVDKYGNEIKVPAGFKITTDADNVTQGIVIEDVSANDNISKGNQFVWIPVGDVYTTEDKVKTEENTKKIELARYVFKNDGTVNEQLTQTKATGQLMESVSATDYYTDEEGLEETFVKSVKENNGYYIGRYEAGDDNATKKNEARNASSDGTLVCKSGQQVYNYIDMSIAKKESEKMYENKIFKSDLVNSFAWDTAILFEQTFDDRTDKSTPYSKQSSLNSSLQTTGTSGDKICNIYDMASNCQEWSTEVYSEKINFSLVTRGWDYRGGTGASCRFSGNAPDSLIYYGFRTILYL